MTDMLHALLCAWLVSVGAESQTPRVSADYGAALREARAEAKPLLVVIDSPTRRDKRVADLAAGNERQPEVTELLKPYKLCRVDVSTDYGKQVARAFGVSTLPHTAIIDKTGSVILHQQSGELPEEEWSGMLQRHRSGIRPVRRLLERVIPGGRSLTSGSGCFT